MQTQMVSAKLPNGSMGMRVAPRMTPQAYRSFEVHSPLSTHYRSATCAEVECQHYLSGWLSRIDMSTPLGVQQARAIKASGRTFTEESVTGTVVVLRFAAGQACFQAPHKVPTGRPELYVVRDGDWRGNPTGRSRKHKQPVLFVEEFEENLSRIRDRIEQG